VNESKNIRLEVADGFYLSPIVRADKAAYLEHFADPEIAQNLLAIPFPYTEADADWWLDRCEQSVGSPITNFALRAPSGYLIGAIGVVGPLHQMLTARSSVTGWRSLTAGTVLCLASSAHSAATHFNTSEFIGFLLHLSPPTLLRTAHWRRQVFSAKAYSDTTTSSEAFTSMQLSMPAFLTPRERPNQSMKPTAGSLRGKDGG
jgi:hypothetical protein